MSLAAELAQRIVTIGMAVAHRNVNVMDPRGVILASGHTSRVGTLHAGARQAAATGKVVEITPAQAPQVAGALEGINMPILVGGDVLAVVGVYGDPRSTRPIARLVRQIATHILEREQRYRQQESQAALRGDLLGYLLDHGEGAIPPPARPLAASLGFDTERPRFLLLAAIGVESGATPFPEEYRLPPLVALRLAEIESLLRGKGLLVSADFLGVRERRLLVLFDAGDHPAASWMHARAVGLQRGLADFLGLPVLCGISGAAASEDLPILRRQGEFSLLHCRIERPLVGIDEPDVLLAWLRLVGLSRPGQIAAAPLSARLAAAFASRPVLRETLTALLAATLDASVAANRLGVHRNTLTYRLRHFEQVTGLAPQRRFADAALCFFLATPADRPPA